MLTPDKVKEISEQRLLNSEYQRGFMEGQHAAAMEFAKTLEKIVKNHDHIASSKHLIN